MKVILDTDLTNEIDDYFALVYCLSSEIEKNLLAITLEPYDPFWHDYDFSCVMGKNLIAAKEILNILNKNQNLVYEGSSEFFEKADKNKEIAAVNKIIELASTSKVLILAIGCLTNIALAIIQKPSIAKNITLYWLGGRSDNYKIKYSKNNHIEFNLRQDIKAAQIVFDNVENITMIYSKEVAGNIRIPLEIMIEKLKGTNRICDYLLEKYLALDLVKVTGCKTLYDIAIPILYTHPEYFKIELARVNKINNEGNYIYDNKQTSKVKYCLQLNNEKVINELLEIIKK